MIKSIKMKKVIGENPEKRLEEELMEKDLYSKDHSSGYSGLFGDAEDLFQ